MSELNGKEVVYGVTAAPMFVPGCGSVGPTLTSSDGVVHKNITMTLDGSFVVAKVKDKVNQTVTVLIPITSFTHMVLAK